MTVLFVFGISGIIGAFTATKVVDKHISGALTLPLVLTAVSLLLIYPACATLPSILTLCIVWGAAVTAVSLAFQTIVLNVAPDAADIATSLFSGIFNIGIGGGAFLGSMISGSFGFHPVTFVGSGLVTVSALCVSRSGSAREALCFRLKRWRQTPCSRRPTERLRIRIP